MESHQGKCQGGGGVGKSRTGTARGNAEAKELPLLAYEQAEPLYLQALELRQRLLGDNHLDVAGCLNNLAALYKSQGRYNEAKPIHLQALALKKRLLGDNHPDVAISLNNLAVLYRAQGRYNEAEPLYLQALEITERMLGSNHPNTVTIRKSLQKLRDNRAHHTNEGEFTS